MAARRWGKVRLLAAVGDITGDGYPDLMGQPRRQVDADLPRRRVHGLPRRATSRTRRSAPTGTPAWACGTPTAHRTACCAGPTARWSLYPGQRSGRTDEPDRRSRKDPSRYDGCSRRRRRHRGRPAGPARPRRRTGALWLLPGHAEGLRGPQPGRRAASAPTTWQLTRSRGAGRPQLRGRPLLVVPALPSRPRPGAAPTPCRPPSCSSARAASGAPRRARVEVGQQPSARRDHGLRRRPRRAALPATGRGRPRARPGPRRPVARRGHERVRLAKDHRAVVDHPARAGARRNAPRAGAATVPPPVRRRHARRTGRPRRDRRRPGPPRRRRPGRW